MVPFKILYCFESQRQILTEVKRLDLPKDAPPGDVYHWLFIDDGQIKPLCFKSMSSGEKEFREFKEGHLVFDERRAQLSLESELELQASTLPEDVLNSISIYLRGR